MNNANNILKIFNWIEKPYTIFLSSVIIVIIFSNLPMNPGYELALAFIPMFILGFGLILTIIYWVSILIYKKKLPYLFYFLLISNSLLGIIITIQIFINS